MIYQTPFSTTNDFEHSSIMDDANRLARLRFHIQTGDYFPTLATILGFIEETILSYTPEQNSLPSIEFELIKSVRKDLMYLHEYYAINPKTETA